MLQMGMADFNQRTQSKEMARVKLWKNSNNEKLNRKDSSARKAKKEQLQGSMDSQKARRVSLMG